MKVDRATVLAYRCEAQGLSGDGGGSILDAGVQDTGPDGHGWALELRGAPRADLALAWTIRGAPHAYRRSQLAAVAAATAPFSEADAAKRIFDANKPLRAAGIAARAALAQVADTMRQVVTKPMVKGDVSSALTPLLPEPFLRFCRPCNATHLYEQPFRLAALQAGLEIETGTSPPVLKPIKGWRGAARKVPAELDVIRSYLHFLGPATPSLAAGYLDAPKNDVQDRWPDDAVEVDVEGERRWILEADAATLRSASCDTGLVRLVGPYDLFVQAKDRELLVPDDKHRKALWPVLGRPGAIVRGGEIVGTWRPRAAGKKLALVLDPWTKLTKLDRELIDAEANRLATFRNAAAVTVTG